MNKRTYDLIVGLIGGISTIAVTIVTFFKPSYMTAINASIGIFSTAAIEIVSQFYKGK